jgi:hypothetical protein
VLDSDKKLSATAGRLTVHPPALMHHARGVVIITAYQVEP